MSVNQASNKVVSTGYKFKRAIKPIATALPVMGRNVTALRGGGVKGVIDMNLANLSSWRPPDFNTVNAYLTGAGGAALMTTIAASGAKWLLKLLSFDGLSSLNLLIDAVQDGGEGAAVGAAIDQIIYPSTSQIAPVSGSLGGAFSWPGGNAQPAVNSEAEFATKKDKPMAMVVFK